MRRLYIIRKDLHLSPGKLSAMVAHCSEAYWTNLIKNSKCKEEFHEDGHSYQFSVKIDGDVFDNYVNASFVKTLCEAKNLAHLKKVEIKAKELGLKECLDYGYINDRCLTELAPENEDGTCTVGIWFKPLPDEQAHYLSKKYQLYKGE